VKIDHHSLHFSRFTFYNSVLSEKETIPQMLAPDDWHWVFYDINHFNMSKFATFCLNTSTNAEETMPDYDWVHTNQSTEVMGWQDYHFLWMSEVEDATFEHPGPASGRRGEWLPFLSSFQLIYIKSFFFLACSWNPVGGF